ncbi:AAA family ATPase [Companilactobacillus ginsenosidimutans]|uniref:Rad50/SbcC-type AAA domain-containing protein n=1 Tax=Companilactobacillus ginsenosidimutans TaxID=1007676 RepID=A0A0H4QL37_9LACO|nr:AAA family ATPase [Companilactobacillus ginsenosidimutans]AKP67418.1 hypothetical protein ABM34_07640 [Companilactobacillus ginsenosidimutans]
MFTSLTMKNYKSFDNITINFEAKKNHPKKLMAIFGENGSGKSTILSAFSKLRLSINTISNIEKLNNLSPSKIAETKTEWISQISTMDLNSNFTNVNNIFKDSIMVASTGPMVINFEFILNGHKGNYELVFQNGDNNQPYLVSETLNFLINKVSGTLFSIKYDSNNNISIIQSPKLVQKSAILKINDYINEYWGDHTFLSIINQFASENFTSKNLFAVLNFFKSMGLKTDETNIVNNTVNLLTSENSIDNQSLIKTTELALNKYLIPLLDDISGVRYKTVINLHNEIEYELWEKKRIYGKYVEIKFSFESNGIKNILKLFPHILNAIGGNVELIDDIDHGLHTMITKQIVENIEENIDGQLIFTTSDTHLMTQLKKKYIYIIWVDSVGNKAVYSLDTVQFKVRKNNNIEKIYIDGGLNGIPFSSDVNFYDIVEGLKNSNE